MKQKTIIVLWAIAILLAASVFAVHSSRNKEVEAVTELKAGDKLYADFPAEEIAEMVFETSESKTVLKKEGEEWFVSNRNSYSANTPAANVLIRSINDMEITQSLSADLEYNGRFGLDETSDDAEKRGLSILFNDASGKGLRKLVLGKSPFTEKFPDGSSEGRGRYVKKDSESKDIYVLREGFPGVTSDSSGWLNTQFVRVTKPLTITVDAPADEGAPGWVLERSQLNEPFGLLVGPGRTPLQESESAPYNTLFNNLKFEDVLRKGEVALDKPESRKVTIKTEEGFTYVFKINRAEEAGFYEMGVNVEANFPTERKVAAGETEETKKAKDEGFKVANEFKAQRLEREQKLQGWVYKISSELLVPVLKLREQLEGVLEAPKPVGAAKAPAESAVNQPLQATTPPIPLNGQ